MWQEIAIGIIGVLAIGYVVRKVYHIVTGRKSGGCSGGCGCGCGGCSLSKPHRTR